MGVGVQRPATLAFALAIAETGVTGSSLALSYFSVDQNGCAGARGMRLKPVVFIPALY